MSPLHFILASSSPRRRELIASLGISPQIIKPDIDETQHPGEMPLEYVLRLSREKAHAAAQQVEPPAAILAADTVVILAADTIGIADDGEILGKPIDAADAEAMLKRLRGRAHQVCTAVTLLRLDEPPQEWSQLTCTTVWMRDYSDDEIRAYIATRDPFDKAGSYAIQHKGFRPVEQIDGSYTNVVGLPLEAVEEGLRAIGWGM